MDVVIFGLFVVNKNTVHDFETTTKRYGKLPVRHALGFHPRPRVSHLSQLHGKIQNFGTREPERTSEERRTTLAAKRRFASFSTTKRNLKEAKNVINDESKTFTILLVLDHVAAWREEL